MFKKARYAYEIYKEGSYTKASKKLGVSQPCLSQAINAIEKKLGSPLFDRSGVPLVPTPAGYEYIKAARQICEIQDDFDQRLSEINSLSRGALRIGCPAHVILYILPEVLGRFRKKYPEINISVTESDSGGLMDMLLDGGVDLVLDSFDGEPLSAAFIPLFEERVLLAVPESFNENSEISSACLLPQELYRRCTDISRFMKIDPALFRKRAFVVMEKENALGRLSYTDFIPDSVIRAEQLTTAYSLVSEGKACAFITDTPLRLCKQQGPVRLYNFAGGGYNNIRCRV